MYSEKEKKKSHFNRQKTGFIKVNKGRVVKYYGGAISEGNVKVTHDQFQ